MKTSAFLAAAAGASFAHAHSTLMHLWVNGVDQGRGDTSATNGQYIRSPPNNNPLTDVTSSSMTCNVNNAAVAKTITVAPGDKLTLEWHHNTDDSSDDIIADSHKGPILTYIAPTSSNGAGDVWVKIAEEGYDASTSKWAVDNLIANKGKHDITLPNLAPGDYLIRDEIIALHEGDRLNGAQFYMECVQITVSDGGSVDLPAGVAIPGTYTANDAGILFNLYSGSITSYPIPGPAVWDGTSSGSGSGSGSSSSAAATSATAPATSAATSAAATSTSVSVAASSPATTLATSVKPTSTVEPTQSFTFISSVTSASPAATSSAPADSDDGPVTVTVTVTASGCTGVSTVASPTAVAAAAKYQQCGGKNFTGASTCASGLTCTKQNDYYSQCL